MSTRRALLFPLSQASNSLQAHESQLDEDNEASS